MEWWKKYYNKGALCLSILAANFICAAIFVPGTVFADSAQVVVYENQLQQDFDGDGVYESIFIKAVDYAPFPIGRTPDESSINYPGNIYDNLDILHRDFSLLAKMHANAVSIFYANQHEGSLDHLTTQTLDAADEYNLKVIAGYHVPVTLISLCDDEEMRAEFSVDITDPIIRQGIVNDYVDFVSTFDDHVAVLFWAIHADDDFSLRHASSDQKQAWLTLVNEMARAGKSAESEDWVPVAMIDNYFEGLVKEDIAVDNMIPDIDLVGIRALGHVDVNAILTEYVSATEKPLWMAGFGSDAWLTKNKDNPEQGVFSEKDQAQVIDDVWSAIIDHKDIVLGASAYSYSDALWKRGDNDVQDYDGVAGWDFTCPADGKFDLRPAVIDKFYNDEWWGITTFIDGSSASGGLDQVVPREAYYVLQRAFNTAAIFSGGGSANESINKNNDRQAGAQYLSLNDLEDQTVSVQEALILPVKSSYETQVDFVVTLGNGDPVSYIGASFHSDGFGGKLTWTPSVEYADTIQLIKFAVYQGSTLKESKVIFIYVKSRNSKPTAISQTVMVQQNKSVSISLQANDPDEDELNYVITIEPQFGTLSGVMPDLVYTPDEDYIGSDHFAFTVDDGVLTSQQTHIGIIIAPDETRHSGYVRGQVVVKFRTTGPYAIPYDLTHVLERNVAFANIVPRSGDAIDQVVAKYNIHNIESLYPRTDIKRSNDETAMVNIEDLYEAEKVNYLKQQARYRPDEYEEFDDEQLRARFHTYVITFNHQYDVLDVIKDFARLPHVDVVRGNDLINRQDSAEQEKSRHRKTKKQNFLNQLNLLREGL